MITRAAAAALAATVLSSPAYTQTMKQSVSTTVNAAAAIGQNGDPLPRGKAEDVGMSSERLGRDRQSHQRRYREGPPARRRDRDRAQGQARLLRDVRLPRQGGQRRDDQGHDLQHRVDDQADGRARRAATAGARQAADRRSVVEIFSEIRQDGSRRAQRERRHDHRQGAGQAADHASASDDAYVRPDLRRARQHRRAQALSGQQLDRGRDHGRRGVHGRSREAAAAQPSRRGLGLRLRPRCARFGGREGVRAKAERILRAEHHKAARHDRHSVLHPAREGGALRQGTAERSRNRGRCNR